MRMLPCMVAASYRRGAVRPVATGGGGHFGAVPPSPLKLSAPLLKIQKMNPVLVTLKSHFLVFNTSCKTQLNNKFNQHHFHLSEGLTSLFQLPRCLDRTYILNHSGLKFESF